MSELFRARSGRGRPFLVIHGGLGLDHTYMRALDRVSDLVELIYVDIRGNGRSPRDGVATITFESICDELDALRAELGHARWGVIGHSFGSFVALKYAMRHPTRLDGLVAIATAASFDHAPATLAALDARDRDAAAALKSAIGVPATDDAAFAELWRRVLPLYFHAWHPRHFGAFADTVYSAAGYNRGGELLGGYDIRGELARVTSPALVIAGDDDFVTPVDRCGAQVARSIEHARLAVIPEAGHFPHLEAPIAFDAELRSWLTSADRT